VLRAGYVPAEGQNFFLFGFYANAIAKAFFPSGDEVASLMMTFMTFGAGFLMRPLGAIILGAYVDRVGRRQGLIVTLALMALGYALNQWLSPAEVGAWGWRIPFFVGCLIVPVLFVIRRSLQETEEFKARKHRPELKEIFQSMLNNWALVISGMMLVAMTTVSFYLITVYTPTFGKNVLHLGTSDALMVTLFVGVSNFFWLPVMGSMSDRVGRRPLLICFTVLAIFTAYPALHWLVQSPSFGRMLGVELWLSFLYASYNGAMVVALTEVMPVEVRTVGFSLAYSLATAVFGGFTPAIATGLIEYTGDKSAPGWWLTFAAVCGLCATLLLYRRQQRQQRHAAGVPGRA
jgi:MHS family citrate/tricarballylate:H+ symporter-like MFS transporter